MSIKYITRIKKDIAELINKPLNANGINIQFHDTHINKLTVVIRGDRDTPYYDCFYMFDITLPDNYPIEPPNVNFVTMNSQIRFHPNIYRNGKVCLSILNTWSGPSWTPSNTLRNTILAIKSYIFTNNPLLNEPGHDLDSEVILETYNKFIYYHSLEANIILMGYTAEKYPNISSEICRYITENYDDYMNKINDAILRYDADEIIETEYGMSGKLDYMDLMGKYKRLTLKK